MVRAFAGDSTINSLEPFLAVAAFFFDFLLVAFF